MSYRTFVCLLLLVSNSIMNISLFSEQSLLIVEPVAIQNCLFLLNIWALHFSFEIFFSSFRFQVQIPTDLCSLRSFTEWFVLKLVCDIIESQSTASAKSEAVLFRLIRSLLFCADTKSRNITSPRFVCRLSWIRFCISSLFFYWMFSMCYSLGR